MRSAPEALRGVLQELLASVGAGAAALESPRWAVVDAGRLDDLLARPE